MNFILILLAIVSAILFTVTIISFVSNTKKRKRYSECTGTIVRILERSSSFDHSNSKVLSPIVSYTIYGKQYEFEGFGYSTKMQIGQEVIVLFDEDDPSQAIMKKGLYLAPFVTGIACAAFTTAFFIMAALKHAGLLSF